MHIEEFLSRLDKPKSAGAGKWVAKCPAHLDNSPSLSIKQAEDGKILLHCFAGCTVDDVCASVGTSVTDLFPEKAPDATPMPRPIKFDGAGFTALDALRCLAHEAAVVGAASVDLSEGAILAPQERDRLSRAVSRIAVALAFVEDACSL